MDVKSQKLSMEYLHSSYAFCSEQCRKRFKDNPHLYIGVPGEKAPKKKGQQVLKTRCFRLESFPTTDEVHKIISRIDSMMGIKQVTIEGCDIHVKYDLLEATAEQIENVIIESGVSLSGNWMEKMRRALVYYTEDCEAANLEASSRSDTHQH